MAVGKSVAEIKVLQCSSRPCDGLEAAAFMVCGQIDCRDQTEQPSLARDGHSCQRFSADDCQGYF